MFHVPDHIRTVSLKLSEVLSDVGVSKKMVKKRRRMILLMETVQSISQRLAGGQVTLHRFGSQSEGSTTLGLKSDVDTLCCSYKFNVIQDWNEWQSGMTNLLTIQDETTSPGYCLLQRLKNDEPLPVSAALMGENLSDLLTVSGNRVLLKNTFNNHLNSIGQTINGPATSLQGYQGFTDFDFVLAFYCKTWPKEAQHWLIRQDIGGWPSNDLKTYCESTGFFVVPVRSKSGRNEETEWRISTSAAERCLMFSLNMTQLRCYILMKMVVKKFINLHCNGVISSFICKTVLFHVIQGTRPNNWRKSNLLACLICCLTILQKFVTQENCPHFIIPENNLLAGKITPRNKLGILAILQHVIQSDGRALVDVPYDEVGTRLLVKMNGMNEAVQFYKSPAQKHTEIQYILIFNFARSLNASYDNVLEQLIDSEIEIVLEKLSEYILITRSYTEIASFSLEKAASKLLLPFMYSSLGSVKASGEIHTTHNISLETLTWFSTGLNSDVASGRLKLASALYCVGDIARAEFVLSNTEEKYDLNTVEPICGCYEFKKAEQREGFKNECIIGHEKCIQQITAFCVKYLRCERYCVPKELHYEMFRLTQEDMLERDELFDSWMDMAVVDSLPFLYFLQFKTYDVLRRLEEKERALANLVRSIATEPNLCHKETALNLLGQCMEQENRHNEALHCYLKSLAIRPRSNAAKFHISRLLHDMANRQFI